MTPHWVRVLMLEWCVCVFACVQFGPLLGSLAAEDQQVVGSFFQTNNIQLR